MNVEHGITHDVGVIRGSVIPALMLPLLLAGIAALNVLVWLQDRKKRWAR